MVAIILYLLSSLHDGYRFVFRGTQENDEHKQEEKIVKLLDDINEFFSQEISSYADSADYYNDRSFFIREDEVYSFNRQSIVTPPNTCKNFVSLNSEELDKKSDAAKLLIPKKVEDVKIGKAAEHAEEFDLQKRVKIKQKAKNNENFETFKMLNEARVNSQKINDEGNSAEKTENIIKIESSAIATKVEEPVVKKEIETVDSKIEVLIDHVPALQTRPAMNVEPKPVSDEIASLKRTEIKNLVKTDEKKPLQQFDEVVSSTEEVLYLSNDDIKTMLQNAPKKSSLNESFIKETKSSIPRPKKRLSFKEERHLYSLQRETSDTMDYRLGYPGLKDNTRLNDNVGFLMGKIKSRPNGDYIDSIHKNWWGNYKLLGQQAGYIQWLFPIRIQGTNYDSHALQKHELDTLKSKDNIEHVQSNLLKSYEMMLDFYGIQFASKETGKLQRAENYKDRYDNLSRNLHNSLHITRILKCLGEFELELYQVGFIEFMLEEIFVSKELESLNDGLTRYWIHVVKDDAKRNELIAQAKNLITKDSL